VAAALTAALAGCNGEKVRVPSATGAGRGEWREPADPELFTMRVEALQYEVDRPIGYAEARQRPLSGFALNAKMKWNGCADVLSRYYTALCVAHNEGRLAVEEFGRLAAGAESGLRMLSDLRPEFDAALEAHRSAGARLQERPEAPPEQVRQQVAEQMDAARRAADEVLERAAGVTAPFADDPCPLEPTP
jgi:hypothetical protein